jgi:hypothetical protein
LDTAKKNAFGSTIQTRIAEWQFADTAFCRCLFVSVLSTGFRGGKLFKKLLSNLLHVVETCLALKSW